MIKFIKYAKKIFVIQEVILSVFFLLKNKLTNI